MITPEEITLYQPNFQKDYSLDNETPLSNQLSSSWSILQPRSPQAAPNYEPKTDNLNSRNLRPI
ncbi:hypothetical protein CSC28_2866 [Pseudomonas paraeruginosa]|nr:hypothetical protein CSC28_2866 [Pseudomonas paraeruginosa]